MYHYAPLKSHLAAQSAERVPMTFAEIERVLGRPLPPSAKGKSTRQWWANTHTHSQAKSWLDVGRTAKLDAEGQAVTFIRSQPETRVGVSLDRDLVLTPGRLTAAAIRLLDDVAEEESVDRAEAVALLLNRAALRRRRATLDWFEQNTVSSPVSSADLIRADRDGR